MLNQGMVTALLGPREQAVGISAVGWMTADPNLRPRRLPDVAPSGTWARARERAGRNGDEGEVAGGA